METALIPFQTAAMESAVADPIVPADPTTDPASDPPPKVIVREPTEEEMIAKLSSLGIHTVPPPGRCRRGWVKT